MSITNYNSDIKDLGLRIQTLVSERKNFIYKSINNQLLLTYWEIGKLIVELEINKQIDFDSVRSLIVDLSKSLRSKLGKGFNRSNLTYMRLFYIGFSDGSTLSHQITWSHYIEILKIDNALERSFYLNQTLNENWSVRELRRQKDSALFQRLALSKNKEEILTLAKNGIQIQQDKDILKDPYVLEFLGFPEKTKYSEKQLEKTIIENLQKFLLELGKGFAFISNQYRITINNTHYYVDLLFYHRILKCFVLIDLKIGEVKHTDIGQMNMYLNYFQIEENEPNDKAPIGIILAANKDDIMVQYATGGLSNKVFVSKYQTYLPNVELLQDEVKNIIHK